MNMGYQSTSTHARADGDCHEWQEKANVHGGNTNFAIFAGDRDGTA